MPTFRLPGSLLQGTEYTGKKQRNKTRFSFCTGPCIFLDVCGSNCVEVCSGALSGEPEGTVYVSSDPDRGRSDCDEFENFNEMSLTMQ